MNAQDFKLVNFEFIEWIGDRLNWEQRKFKLSDFNVILSDNAQGKTRLFNILRSIRDFHTGRIVINNPIYSGKCTLWFNEGQDEIVYQFEMKGVSTGQGLTFNEIIKRNENVLFDRSNKILFEEESQKRIPEFFLPNNIPVVCSTIERGYITFNKIRDFIERMLFLQANRFVGGEEIGIDRRAMILDQRGSNIASVMANWRERMPLVYEEVIRTFRNCFDFITDIYIKEATTPIGIKAPFLYLKEKDIDFEIMQPDWSDGMMRALCLFALPCTQFLDQKKDVTRPSLIGVDEIENGLDFNTLTKVINHYESYSNLVQTLIATHSPLVCNLIDPRNWLIIRRKGVNVEVISPSDKEDVDSERAKLKKDNWEFYRRHIAKSNLYRIK